MDDALSIIFLCVTVASVLPVALAALAESSLQKSAKRGVDLDGEMANEEPNENR